MYDLKRVQKEVNDICEKAGVKVNAPVQVNARLTKTLGRVYYDRTPIGNTYITKVEFSKQLLETATDDSIYEVIMHEASHLIAFRRTGERHGHDQYFKSIVKELGGHSDMATADIERTVSDDKIYKYSVSCTSCGATAYYSRMCKTLKLLDAGLCTCRKCGSHEFKMIQNF